MNAPVLAIATHAPTHLLLPVRSDGGDTGTSYFRGYVLEVTDDLRAQIEKAHALLVENDWMHSIAVDCGGIALPGSDNDDMPSDEDDSDRFDEIMDNLEDEPRPVVDGDEVAFLNKVAADGARGECIVVLRHVDPYMRMYEKYGYEYFSSVPIPELTPTALRAGATEEVPA